ncbi:MAG: sulfotransferase domain-containing protein [Planctomycetes bacterium]|nr:sulfotransferase domain-containing protein [Planctomycetota bacterium]
MLRLLTTPFRNRAAKQRLRLAAEQWQRGEHAGAIASCREAVRLRPERPWFHDQLGHFLSHHHDYWLNPELAQRLVDDGSLAAAVAAWRQALALGWRSHHTRLGLGHALTTLGDLEGATAQLRAATDQLVEDTRPELAARFRDEPAQGPDFLIIGGTKCGTTSLYEYLCEHPRVLPAIWKEIEYFRFPERGLDWYLAQLPRIARGSGVLTGEASTCYFAMHEVPGRVRTAYPNVRLVALVRDPVAKAISHYHHDKKLGCEHRSLEEALGRELDLLEGLAEPWRNADDYWRTERGYVWLGLYAPFLEHWLTVFPREQLLILPSDDLTSAPGRCVAEVQRFLGLPEHQLAQYPVHLEGRYERKAHPLQQRLARFFAPHQRRLEDLLGRSLPWTRP